MAKNKVSEWDTTASNNTDIAGINIAEGCAPSGINNAIREVMAQIKDMQTGSDSDGLVVGGVFTSSGGAVFSSTVTMSGTNNMSGINNIGTTTTSSTILSGLVTQTTSSKLYLDDSVTTASAPPLSWDGDTNTGIYRPAADTMALVTGGSDRLTINPSGVVIIGTGEATTSVAGNILRSPSGAGTNIAGSNLEIQAGNGTGTAGSGSIVLKTAAAGSSGSTANTLTQRLLVTKNGGFSFGSGATDYGTAGQVLKSAGDAPPTFSSPLTSGTAVASTSGTSVDFTSIPSWVKRITVMLNGVSLSGTDNLLVQIGSGSLTTSGYVSGGFGYGATISSTAGFIVPSNSAARLTTAQVVITNVSGNIWIASCVFGAEIATVGGGVSTGTITIGGALDRVSVTRTGTNTFDAGSINILYE